MFVEALRLSWWATSETSERYVTGPVGDRAKTPSWVRVYCATYGKRDTSDRGSH
jgi:hypothetical protein